MDSDKIIIRRAHREKWNYLKISIKTWFISFVRAHFNDFIIKVNINEKLKQT